MGHATVLCEMGGSRLLTDPVLRGRLGHLRRHGAPPRPEVAQGIDAVLISHVHLDHLDFASLRRLGSDVRMLVPRGAGRLVARKGLTHVDELVAGDRLTVGGATVTAVRAVHDGRRHPLGAVADTLGYEIAGAHRVYFAGDTELFDAMGELAGGLDVALLPVWGWGPSLGPGHLDPLGAARAAAMLRPRFAIPIHWGTLFPVGLASLRGHALVDPPHAFQRHLATLAPEVRARLLAPGEAMTLDRVAA